MWIFFERLWAVRDQPLTHFFWTTVQVTFYDTVSEWPLFAARPLQTGAAKEEGLPFLTIGVDRARGEFSQPLEDALVREVFEGGVHGAHGRPRIRNLDTA